MAEEFHQAGICGGNSWWTTSSRHALAAASPCSVGFNNDQYHMGSFGFPNDMVDMKAITRPSSCGEIIINNYSVSNSDDDNDDDLVQNRHDHSFSLQMIGFGLSSTPSDFNQALLLSRSAINGRVESCIFDNSMLQEDMGNTKLNYQEENCRMDDEDSSTIINELKPLMNQDFSINQLGSSNSSSGFPISSFSSSPLLQSLFDSSDQVHQPQQSLFNNHFSSNDLLLSPSTTTPTWPPPPRYSPRNCVRPSSSIPKQLQPAGVCGGSGVGLQFSNNINTPFWNAPAPAASTNGLFSSTQSQYSPPTTFHEQKPNSHNFTTKGNSNEDVDDSTSSVGKKSGSSIMTDQTAVFKRARIETPSPLPTFKVRKEKLGDRITALQQLVSPFGKTDTASVLHEAIEYIRFLHDQVSALSSPYMKNGAPMQHQQGSSDRHKMKEATQEGAKEDLKSRGLCLVPISSTFPVASETTADFWTPTFGATFR